MATTTGKAARKRLGNRFACKRAKTKKPKTKTFGKLPVSESRGNAEEWRRGSIIEPTPEPSYEDWSSFDR